jgi:cytoskeletal protein RodZ
LPYNDDEEADAARAAAILSAGAAAAQTPLDGRDGPPLDESGKDAVSAKRSKRKTKKLFIAAVAFFLLLLLVLVGAVFALRAMRGGEKNPTLKVGAVEEKKGGEFSDNLSGDEKLNAALNVLSRKSPPPDGGGGAGADSNQAAATGGDAITNTNLNTVAADKSQHDGLHSQRSETVPDAGGDTRQPGGGDVRGADESAGARAQSPTTGAGANGSQSAGGGASAVAQRGAGGAMTARSVLHSPRKDATPSTSVSPAPGRDPADGGSPRRAADSTPAVSLPSFGAMLPIKTLGAIYTLRSQGGVVRFQVSYDRRGKGWFVPKGTEIIGVVRGSDYDRAYITMTGLIDPGTGKFIKLSGDILAADGASGMVGKRRQVSGGWSRFFDRLRDAGLGALGTLAGGIGRGPVIITDVYRRGVEPVTSELSGVLGDGRNSFVQIGAGVSGYAFVTQMPDEVHGVDELAGRSRDTINSLSDSAEPRASTGLSEDELAELLTGGDPEAIRKALPRMTPQMRRVAEGFLADAGSAR